ncbi:MAG: phage protein Gp27 family protein [Ruminococcus sp.]|nr:phage protein Gp27 family protein [Ruminococcus sp.]
MKKKNRKHSIIDGLPSELRDAVDEMIKSDFTYHEIVDYIRKNGVEISMSSVQRYASSLNETLQSLRLAQENFRAVMEETEKYKNLDVTDGILRLLSNQVFQAINQIPEEQVQNTDFETLMKNAVALTRAVAYKKKIDIDSRDALENGAEQFQGYIFEAMSEERPELYKELKKFIKEKQL